MNTHYSKLILSMPLLYLLLIMSTLFTLANLTLLPLPANAQPSTNSSSQNLSNSPGSSTDPQIAVYQNNVYVVWSDNSTGNGDIYFKRSVIHGTIFSETRNLSNNTGLSSNPQLSAVGSNVYVAWTDTSSGNN